ncbi:hypothetical protein OU426_02040 [Frigidibacter sp. RF13]|uniref:hypothetical protein n=1 Tax=Frigidibacter sp. RF13 TaxID=2997340 RepID=UPI00226F8624|nr:hypothetical protein [Frigidibacter sp. RF13]MCY1125622.1 hypothetical protein [Frigidibacter sp. RF13]
MTDEDFSQLPDVLRDILSKNLRLLVLGSCRGQGGCGINDVAAWQSACGLAALTAAYWADGAPPDAVLAPLLAPDFDILDVAERLTRLGFRGVLLISTPHLPDPGTVLAEIRGACTGFRAELVEIGEGEADLTAGVQAPAP